MANLFQTPTPSSKRFETTWQALRQRLSLPEKRPRPDTLTMPEIRTLEPPVLDSLKATLGEDKVHHSKEALYAHTFGRTYSEYLRQHSVCHTPSAILFPESETEIAMLMNWATEREIRLLPWGCGTDPYFGKLQPEVPLIVVNMKHMGKILAIDSAQRQVRVQAGIQWQSVESALADYQLTTAQQFIASDSSVGGRIATNAHGLKSLGYGSFNDNIHTIRAIAPTGPLYLQQPQPGNIDARGLALGNYGSWAIITEVTLRVYPTPNEKIHISAGFKTWEQAVVALWQIIQAGLAPAWARVIDAEQHNIFNDGRPNALTRRGLRLGRVAPESYEAYLSIGLEGQRPRVSYQRTQIEAILREKSEQEEGNNRLSLSSQETVHQDTYIWPYSAEIIQQLWKRGILIETVTATVPWIKAESFRQNWEEALQSILQATSNAPGLTLTTLYGMQDYAILYTMVIGMQADNNQKQQEQLAAIRTVAQATKKRWNITTPVSPMFGRVINAAEKTFNPAQIMLQYRWRM